MRTSSPRPVVVGWNAIDPALRARRVPRGFTLVELLVVMGVMIVLLGLIVPAVISITKSKNLDYAGQNLESALTSARDQAMASNHKANVRLLSMQDGGTGPQYYRAVQVWIVTNDIGTMAPLGNVIQFPPGVILSQSATLSPLLQNPPAQSGTMAVGGVNTNYLSFFFTANGVPDNPITSANSYLTLVREQDANTASPVNFYALFINPVTGEVTTYRP